MRVSVIIPAWNEERALPGTLGDVRALGVEDVIVVDGGSEDRTREVAERAGARVIASARGRGAQMHAGAQSATGDVYWFLHADTRVSREAYAALRDAVAREPQLAGGNFALRFSGESTGARVLEWLYPRLRYLGLCYGDSGFFVVREQYWACGGFATHPLFEDLDLLRRLRRGGRFVHLPVAIESSSRRWERGGFAKVFARWMVLQVLYWLGAPPRWLSARYAPVRE